MRNVLLVINSVLTSDNNNFWNFPLGQISYTIFWGAEGLGEGCVKITLIVSCLEWFTCLFLFTMVEFEKVLYTSRLKNSAHFSCYKTLPKRYNVQLSHEMLRNAMVSDMPDGRSVQPPPPSGKLAAQLKLPFGDSC